jgi:hypothetical protein
LSARRCIAISKCIPVQWLTQRQRFGAVESYEDQWDTGYCFAVYKEYADADIAVKTLKDFRTRKAFIKVTLNINVNNLIF